MGQLTLHQRVKARGRTALLALLFLNVFSAKSATTVTLGTLVPEGTSYHKSLLEMRDKWRKAPGGGVHLKIYAGGKTGGEANMVKQMRLGALDAGLLTAVGLSEIESAVSGLQNLPMMFRSLDEVDYVTQKLTPLLGQRLEAKGFVVLYWADAGWVRFFSKERMLRPDDLRKMKLFTWAGDPKFVDLWKAAGFQPVPLETADIVPMLDTGLINATPMPPFVALAGQVYTRAPHMLELNWAPLLGGLVIRKPVWDRLPPAAREVMLQASAEAGRKNKKNGRIESDEAVVVMQKKGLIVHEVTPELDAEWRKAAEQFYPRIKGTLVPADIFAEVERLLKEYRNSGGAPKP